MPLELAHNCTVTERNIASVPEVVRWFLADPARSRIWRILSFQPEANTGRTIFSRNPVTPAGVWQKICDGMGLKLDGSAYLGGHPDCNQGTTLLVERRRVATCRFCLTTKKRSDFLPRSWPRSERSPPVTTDADAGASLLPYRVAGAFSRHPQLVLRSLARILALVASGQIPWVFLCALVTGRAQTINIGTHNFMDASRVANAPNDTVTRARLDACVFKGAVKNRATGEWEAVPMCSMNQARWSELYAERLAG